MNAILDRLQLDQLLAGALSPAGRVSAAKALGVLLRNIVLNDRQPISAHAERAARVEPPLLDSAEGKAGFLIDDRVGRELDRFFDADRAALMTEVVRRTIGESCVAPS